MTVRPDCSTREDTKAHATAFVGLVPCFVWAVVLTVDRLCLVNVAAFDIEKGYRQLLEQRFVFVADRRVDLIRRPDPERFDGPLLDALLILGVRLLE